MWLRRPAVLFHSHSTPAHTNKQFKVIRPLTLSLLVPCYVNWRMTEKPEKWPQKWLRRENFHFQKLPIVHSTWLRWFNAIQRELTDKHKQPTGSKCKHNFTNQFFPVVLLALLRPPFLSCFSSRRGDAFHHKSRFWHTVPVSSFPLNFPGKLESMWCVNIICSFVREIVKRNVVVSRFDVPRSFSFLILCAVDDSNQSGLTRRIGAVRDYIFPCFYVWQRYKTYILHPIAGA